MALLTRFAKILAMCRIIRQVDRNTIGHHLKGNQGVTRDAFVARQMGRIMAADTDGDGRVSKAELTAMMAGAGATPTGSSRGWTAMAMAISTRRKSPLP
jgi:hypothetical protein